MRRIHSAIVPYVSISSSFGGVILRVLHVLPAGEFGGAESQILALAKGLQAQAIDVEVVTYFEGEFAQKARAASIAVKVFPSDGLFSDRQRLTTYLEEKPADLLHTHGVRASVIGRLVGKRLKIPVVTTIHSDLYYDYASPLRRFLFMQLERRTRHLSARVIAVSSALARILLSRGYDARRLVVIKNGMDTKHADTELALAKATPIDLRRSLLIAKDAWLVFCAARLHPVKRHDVLIRAFSQVREVQGRPVHLVLAGDGSERARLESLATQVAPSRVHFLGARTDVFALLAQADVFALVSQMEGLPIALLEAMYASVPVITTKVGGMIEVVQGSADSGDTVGDVVTRDVAAGVMVQPDDAQALADAIATLLADSERLRTMGEVGHARVRDQYSLQQMATQVATLYKDITKNKL